MESDAAGVSNTGGDEGLAADVTTDDVFRNAMLHGVEAIHKMASNLNCEYELLGEWEYVLFRKVRGWWRGLVGLDGFYPWPMSWHCCVVYIGNN